MKTKNAFAFLVLICGMAFNASCEVTVTTMPTNGPTTLTVHARTKDGTVPVWVSCFIAIGGPPYPPKGQSISILGKSGDWTAANVSPGYYEVHLQDTNDYMNWTSYAGPVEAETNYTFDFVMPNEGWISGRVELPAREFNRDLGVTAVKQDDASNKPVRFEALCSTNGVFRFWFMLPGIYTLYVNPMVGGSQFPISTDLGSVSNIAVITGQETTNVIIPGKMVVQTNGASGR